MKVSIVTVCYNGEKYIRTAMDSVLKQTHKNIEYIVIDGMSKDNTVNIIKEYEPQLGGRLKWISEKDKGLYDAMNKGVNMATGDIVGILNSDDFFTSDAIIEHVVNAFKSRDVDAVYGDVHFVGIKNLNECVRYYSSRKFKRSLMRIGLMPAHPSFYVKRSCFEKYGCYKTDYKIGADFDLLLRFIYVNAIKTIYMPLDMVTMRMGGASTSGLKSYIQIMREQLRSCKENGVYTNLFLLFLRYFLKISELRFGRKSE